MNELGRWADALPRSWQAKPLKAVATYLVSSVDKVPVEGELPVRLCNYTDVYKNDRISLGIDFMQATASKDEIKKFRLQINDVVITKDSESWDDIAVPALVTETADDLVCGYHLAVLRPFQGQICGRYLFRCLQTKSIRTQLELASTGVTRFGLPKDEIGKLLLPVPPLKQQNSIADYLDGETAQMDALVKGKERLLELLAEKRRTLIASAVTRGINPKAPLRDSGFPWLGQIPKHWEVKKLKYLAGISYGVGDELDKTLTSGVPMISLPNVDIEGSLNLKELGWANLSATEKIPLLLRKGDLLFNWRNGSSAHVGKTAYFGAEGEFTHVGFLLRIRFDRSQHEPRFFQAFLQALRATGYFLYTRAMVNNTFNQTELENLHAVVPPLTEQRAIVAHIAAETAKLDKLRASAEHSMALLKERRAALIAAAVTGKIKIAEAS